MGPSTQATLFSHRWPRFCGEDIYSRRKPLFSSFGEHTAVCGSSVRQAVARPRHRQSVFVVACHFLIIIFYVAATCRPSVLGSATKTRPPVAKQSGQCARALLFNIFCCHGFYSRLPRIFNLLLRFFFFFKSKANYKYKTLLYFKIFLLII